MTIKNILDAKIKKALVAKDEIAKSIFRLAKSEIVASEMRLNTTCSEEQESKIIRKIIQSNEEVINAMDADDERNEKLKKENELLSELLPKTLTITEISVYLEKDATIHQILAAKTDGQATGIAMKTLKSEKIPVEGGNVAVAVKKLREYWTRNKS